jgi:hypothetical protein
MKIPFPSRRRAGEHFHSDKLKRQTKDALREMALVEIAAAI